MSIETEELILLDCDAEELEDQANELEEELAIRHCGCAELHYQILRLREEAGEVRSVRMTEELLSLY